MLPSLRYALHPYLPEKLGFRQVLGLVNPTDAKLLRDTDDHTLVIARSRVTLLREGRDVLDRGVPGDFVEFGVHKGGSAAMLATVIKGDPTRQLHLFDRWGDLPEPTEEDGYRKDQYARSKIEHKIATLSGVFDEAKHVVEDVAKFPKDRVHYYQGWYDDTLKEFPDRPIAFASIDCDYYESVKPVLKLCDEHASPGATFIIDDYGTWPGARRAVHEWMESTRRKVRLTPVLRGSNAVLHLLD